MFQFEGFPIFNCDAYVNEKVRFRSKFINWIKLISQFFRQEKIQKFRDAYKEQKSKACEFLRAKFEERGIKFEKNFPIDLIFSDNFTVYQYPSELGIAFSQFPSTS